MGQKHSAVVIKNTTFVHSTIFVALLTPLKSILKQPEYNKDLV